MLSINTEPQSHEDVPDRPSDPLLKGRRQPSFRPIGRACRLLEDVSRSVTYQAMQAGCWHPYVKNYGILALRGCVAG